MPILRSPGCNCSCACLLIEEPDYNQSIAANTLQEIPHNIPVNCAVDLTNLLPDNYFSDSTNVFKVHIKDTSGTTTHKTLTYQSVRDSTPLDLDDAEVTFHPRPLTTLSDDANRLTLPYTRRWHKRYLSINDGTYDYESFRTFKSLYVGTKTYYIKSVSAGTFDDREGVAFSLKGSYPSDVTEAKCAAEYTPDQRWGLQKDRYVFLDSSSSQTVKTIRWQRTDKCDNQVETFVRLDYSGGATQVSQGFWANGTQLKSGSFSVTLQADETARLTLRGQKAITCPPETGFIGGTADLLCIPSASATGDGHFELETLYVKGEEGGSTSVKVFRTGGNSTAVDVVVANGNSDVTLSFAAGEIVKEFTVTHDSHNATTLSGSLIPTNDKILDVDQRPLEFVFRKNSYEFGHSDGFNRPIRHAGGHEYWDEMVANERDTWANSSVKLYVESNVATTLESYKLYEIKHEANCSLAQDNADCPEYNRCEVIPEYHEQQFELSCDLGLLSQFMPAISYTHNAGCTSTFGYHSDPLPKERDPRYDILSDFHDADGLKQVYGTTGAWHVAFNILKFDIRSAERTVKCYDDAYWTGLETTVTNSTTCGSYVFSTDFTNMPRSCSAYGSIDYCVTYTCPTTYTNGAEDAVAYPVGPLPDYSPLWSGEYVTACHEITECQSESSATNDGVHQILLSATASKAAISAGSALDEPTWSASIYRAGFRQALVDLVDSKHQTYWQSDGTDWAFVGQGIVHEVDYATTPLDVRNSIDFLDSNTPDYWFNFTYGTNTSEHGYYRVRHQSGTNIMTGPFTAADDGSGNVFASVSEDVGIHADLTVKYFKSYLNEPSGTDLQAIQDVKTPLDGYTVVDAASASFEGDFVMSPRTFYGNYEKDFSADLVTGGINYQGEVIRVDGYYSSDAADPSYPYDPYKTEEVEFTEGDGTVDWPDDVNFSDCRPTVTSDMTLTVDSSFPAVESGYVRKFVDDTNQPARYVGSCTGETSLGGIESICCNNETPGSETIDWSYWEYDGLTDWDGEWLSDGVGSKRSEASYIQSGQGFNNRPYGLGPTSLTIESATYEFPIKWGLCWTEQDQRTESWDASTDTVTGPDKIYPFKGVYSPTGLHFAQLEGTNPEDPYKLIMDFKVDANVINKTDITITAQAYATQWEKH